MIVLTHISTVWLRERPASRAFPSFVRRINWEYSLVSSCGAVPLDQHAARHIVPPACTAIATALNAEGLNSRSSRAAAASAIANDS